jgi:TolB-like protein/Tfp pilus assembly protein PilF
MKRCPECRRDYYDDSLLYCLDDGSALLEGPASGGKISDEPATAILHETTPPGEAATRAQSHLTKPSSKDGAVAPAASNLKWPIAAGIVLVLALGGYFGYRLFNASGHQISSIAVLAFENRSGSADSDYLSDGLTESLIYRLSQIPDLKVSPTSSILRYKGKDNDVQKIAADLGVQTVMSGRMTQRGDSLTISVELIDAANNKLLWGEQYERRMSELLATQREIAAEITNNLKLKLSGTDEAKGAKKYTDNNEAYQLYLKGRFHFAKRGKDDLLKAADYFKQAIDLDPNFAFAYVGVADSYNVAVFNGNLSPQEAMPLAESAVRRALEIDPALAEAHAALANSLSATWRWADAGREYTRALELNPSAADIHYRYARNYLILAGRAGDAVAEMKRALELEPLSLPISSNLAFAYLCDRQRDLALEQAQKTYNLDPNHLSARIWLGLAYIGNGRYNDAIALDEQILQTDPTDVDVLFTVGYAYGRSGRRSDAEAVIKKLHDVAKTRYVEPNSFAVVYTGMGENDAAFAEVEKAFEVRNPNLGTLLIDPLMDPLREDPRFKDLLRRVNLPH